MYLNMDYEMHMGTKLDYLFQSSLLLQASEIQLLKYIAPTENNEFAQLYAYYPKHTSHKTSNEDMYLKMDYEMHMGKKLDYLLFQTSRLLQASEIQLLKKSM